MATLSNAWNVTVGALQADQAALNVVSNNVSNANNTAYTREVPNWEENAPLTINGISYGTGASVTKVTSLRDSVLEKRINQQTSDVNGSAERLTALDNLQTSFTIATSSSTTSSGTSTQSDLNSVISDFFNSLSSLESSPTSTTLRTSVISAANTMSEAFNNIATSLDDQRHNLDDQVSSMVTQINSLTSAVATLNTEIQQAGTGNTNILEDQRQADLTSLSKLVGINEISTENNGLTITTSSGALLVAGGSATTLTIGTGTLSPTVGMAIIKDANGTDITPGITSGGGTLGGLLTVRDQDIPAARTSMDTLASTIVTQMNTLNTTGYTLSTGVHGGAFFTATGTTAATMSVSSSLTEDQIAASGLSTSTGDDSELVQMANLKTTSLASLGNQTITNYYSSFITTLGSTVSQVGTTNAAQSASLSQLQSQRDSLSAVSLDDEAASLQVYEKAYQAASKVFAVLNTILAASINLGQETTA